MCPDIKAIGIWLAAMGASINDVYKISAIFDPPPPLCLLLVVIQLTPLYNDVFQPRPPPSERFLDAQ